MKLARHNGRLQLGPRPKSIRLQSRTPQRSRLQRGYLGHCTRALNKRLLQQIAKVSRSCCKSRKAERETPPLNVQPAFAKGLAISLNALKQKVRSPYSSRPVTTNYSRPSLNSQRSSARGQDSERLTYRRHLVFKGPVTLNARKCLLEVEERRSTAFISITDWPERFELQLPLDQAKQLLGGSLDYEKLPQFLSLDGQQLVLTPSVCRR